MRENIPLLIGVDGGGTSCRAALTHGALRAEAAGGPANISDFDQALAAIAATIRALLQGAGMTEAALTQARLHLGLAGVSSPARAEEVRGAMMRQFDCARITVSDDQHTTFAGAFGSRAGALAAIGTGSFVGRQDAVGLRVLGGWGFRLGDQASGAWLGQRLLQQVMLAVDGMAETSPLTERLLARHNGDPAAIVAFAIAARPADFAALAPDVLAAADDGDAVGLRLLAEGADYIDRALQVLGWAAPEPVCLTGGIGARYARYLPDPVRACLCKPLGSALDGALALAAVGEVR